MPYSQKVNRLNPTCFLFLVDQSGSMEKAFGGDVNKTKAQGVADAINRLLQTLILRCQQGYEVSDRCKIGVVGYGEEVGLGFVGELANEVLQPVSRIVEHPIRIEERRRKEDDGAGGVIERTVKFPVWLDAAAKGKTPMCGAFQAAQEVLQLFLGEHPGCFPPIVINITDGVATDGNPEALAAAIRDMASSDGNVLVFNIHISERKERPILFPASDAGLPDEYAKMLFRMSSVFPPEMRRQATIQEEPVMPEGARCFGFNADYPSLVTLLKWGGTEDALSR
jgi:hypothetical protein